MHRSATQNSPTPEEKKSVNLVMEKQNVASPTIESHLVFKKNEVLIPAAS